MKLNIIQIVRNLNIFKLLNNLNKQIKNNNWLNFFTIFFQKFSEPNTNIKYQKEEKVDIIIIIGIIIYIKK